MATCIEKTGKTVQEAVALALEELNLDEDRVDIEVLDEGGKGIFGLIGSKTARVRVSVKEIAADTAVRFLQDVLDKMGLKAEIEVEENGDSLLIRIKGKDCGIIIGRRGETLDAIQYLTSLVVNRTSERYTRVTIDIENYRSKREETLEKLANRLADRVVRYRRNVTLEPMNPYERRIIHSCLQNNNFVETYSVGDEPNRKVVITLKQPARSRQ
jgi:spoIIIJ-associated protein